MYVVHLEPVLLNKNVVFKKPVHYIHTITRNPYCVYRALGLLMTDSQCNYSMHDVKSEMSFNVQGLISWSTTATGGKSLLEECKISSFCGSVADYFPVMMYKRRSFLKEKKIMKKKKKKIRSNDVDLISFTQILHFYINKATLTVTLHGSGLCFPVLMSLYLCCFVFVFFFLLFIVLSR